MKVFSVKDVERVLKIPRSAIRALIRVGYVAPARGRRRQYEFSFQDLVALRTARALMQARVSPRRISAALRQLRQKVPDTPATGRLRICASGTQVVVRDEKGPWRTPTGQYLLDFEVSVKNGAVEILERPAPAPAPAPRPSRSDVADAESLFDRAAALEERDREAAVEAYRACLGANPGHAAARINCGRLLQEMDLALEAEAVYRAAPPNVAEDPDLLFNLALVLEDTGRELDAVGAYQRALQGAPAFADAHFNLARLYQQLNMPRAAIRHWNCFRRLTLAPK